MSVFKRIISFIALSVTWGCLSLYGALNGWWLTPLASEGDTQNFINAIQQQLLTEAKGNLAITVIENGRVVSQQFSPSIDKINQNTLFPVASMSKLFTAYGIIQLAKTGEIDLDAPIANYLTPAWQLPASSFDHNKVTVRTLLSHTSGLIDGLGFADIPETHKLPSLLQSLQNPQGANGSVQLKLGYAPTSQWQYSGGGYLITEHIIENITGVSFESFMANNVFTPLNMKRATYQFIGKQKNIANSYDSEGKKADFYQYASPAATGLLASTYDLTQFVLALQQIDNKTDNTIRSLTQPLGYKLGAPIWGMGVMLYAPTLKGGFVYGHDGANEPAINSALRINPINKDAIIVLSSGGDQLATHIASEWTFWQTGIPDFLNFDKAISSALMPFSAGIFLLLLGFMYFYYVHTKTTLSPILAQ